MPPKKEQPHVELYVRSLCPSGAEHQPEQITERLNELVEAGRIADFSIHVWGKQVPCDGETAVGEAIRDRIESFKAWSDRAGTTITPSFESRETHSLLTDETHDTIVLPTLCLAEYQGDDLQYVAPCVEDGSVCTVHDRLGALEEEPSGDDWARAHG